MRWHNKGQVTAFSNSVSLINVHKGKVLNCAKAGVLFKYKPQIVLMQRKNMTKITLFIRIHTREDTMSLSTDYLQWQKFPIIAFCGQKHKRGLYNGSIR